MIIKTNSFLVKLASLILGSLIIYSILSFMSPFIYELFMKRGVIEASKFLIPVIIISTIVAIFPYRTIFYYSDKKAYKNVQGVAIIFGLYVFA